MKTVVVQTKAVPPEAPEGYRKQSTDCMKRPKAASSRQTLLERIVAGLAGVPHPGRRMCRNRPQRGRRLPAAGRSSSPSIIGVRFSKRTHMMTPVKTEKRRFPVETVCFDLQGWANQKGFLRNEPK